MRTKNLWTKKISATTPVFVAATMEFLCAELLEVAGLVCEHAKKRIIKPNHIELAIRGDRDFARFF